GAVRRVRGATAQCERAQPLAERLLGRTGQGRVRPSRERAGPPRHLVEPPLLLGEPAAKQRELRLAARERLLALVEAPGTRGEVAERQLALGGHGGAPGLAGRHSGHTSGIAPRAGARRGLDALERRGESALARLGRREGAGALLQPGALVEERGAKLREALALEAKLLVAAAEPGQARPPAGPLELPAQPLDFALSLQVVFAPPQPHELRPHPRRQRARARRVVHKPMIGRSGGNCGRASGGP